MDNFSFSSQLFTCSMTHELKDWAPFLHFGVTFVHANLCLHTLTPELFRVGGVRVGNYLKYSPVAAKIILWCWKTCGKIWSTIVLKCIYIRSINFFGMTKIQCILPFQALFKTWSFPQTIACCYMSQCHAGVFQLLRGCTWMFSQKLY